MNVLKKKTKCYIYSEYNQYISQELGKISRLAKENNWGKRKIQKEIRMLQS